ncbi:MAG: GAF domain-containing sensor histidine kinase [Rhodospirillaceae bacterium]|nr:GAF domain-containing sensor histidine kinase [Rhodospirillaceae bacterium]MBT4773347.1 GAF domain-containing sensor histidine kinase [Rhodospirillaceae bacterium]MBT5359995.1 GAF domain-containing sensor histidine kinase [Rhodospirillaceae bacterium]MBT6311150.1 GAF domain-containing sensor histidine kinase [Rhodospirillaceae bacterium]MBT7363899.1 GAF domain-containing sensor histidine kinase [Rhodospirillaceae bacterium]
MGIPIPPDEPERLENLLSLEVLDTRINYQLETITQIASRTFGAPIALVSLVDSERQWFKAKWGLDVSETPREQAFCAHAIMDRETMVVKDATEDERFSSNPLVTGDPSIRFYAGAPLVTQSGYSIGTLCVIDDKPRFATVDELATLQQLATLAVGILQNETKHAKLQAQTQSVSADDTNPELLLSSLAHELRTPLGHIMGFAELMQTELANDDVGIRHSGFLDIVRQSSEHLCRLVDNLIRFEQSSFTDSLSLEPIDLNGKIDQVVQSFSGAVAAKTQSLAYADNGQNISVLADHTSLRQILTNLISNASKYTPENGKITLVASVDTDHDLCRIEIRDDGPGMPRDVLMALGKPFVRGTTSANPETEGFGLGLHITKRLCEAMNGSLAFTPILAGGTCANIRLPLVTSMQALQTLDATTVS